MSLEQSATVVLAHWPGRASPWFDDLRRIAAFGSPLGSFSTITDYFDETGTGGKHAHYQPDEYRSPYLRQDVAAGRPDPISRWVRYFRRRAEWDAWQALGAVAEVRSVAGGLARRGGDAAPAETAARSRAARGRHRRLAPGRRRARRGIGQATCRPVAEGACRLRTPNRRPGEIGPAGLPDRQSLEFPATTVRCLKPTGCNPWASDASLVDVPAMGFAWVAESRAHAGTTPARKRLRQPTRAGSAWAARKTPPPLAEENVLRNEFCEVHFDPHTGAIRSISDYHSRDPRLAQQIALRLPHGGEREARRTIRSWPPTRLPSPPPGRCWERWPSAAG